jgi:hypothetical protein
MWYLLLTASAASHSTVTIYTMASRFARAVVGFYIRGTCIGKHNSTCGHQNGGDANNYLVFHFF